MFAVSNFEVTENVYLFDKKRDAKRCARLLTTIHQRYHGSRDYECTFIDTYSTYEEARQDNLDILTSPGDKDITICLIYQDKCETLKI